MHKRGSLVFHEGVDCVHTSIVLVSIATLIVGAWLVQGVQCRPIPTCSFTMDLWVIITLKVAMKLCLAHAYYQE